MKLTILPLMFCCLLGATASADDYQAVRDALKDLIPGGEISMIQPAELDGYVEVMVDANLIFVREDGRYLLQGVIYDLERRENLMENSQARIRKEQMAAVSEQEQIVFAAEDPKHEITIFTDIDCGYCRRMHQEIASYNELGISIAYMMFPRAGVGSQSFDKAVSVWCAEDANIALTDAKAGIDPAPAQCDNPIADQFELGRVVGVTGTPAIVTDDGGLLPGYLPPEQLLARLDEMAAE